MKVYVVTNIYEPNEILGVFSDMAEVKNAIANDYVQTWLENCREDDNIDAMTLYFGIRDILGGSHPDYLIKEFEVNKILKD